MRRGAATLTSSGRWQGLTAREQATRREHHLHRATGARWRNALATRRVSAYHIERRHGGR